MDKETRLTSIQAAMMIGGSSLMFPYTFLPILRTVPANQDAWISMLLSLFYMVLFNVPILFLLNRFRGLDAAQMFETILGKPASKVVLSVFFVFSMFCVFACMVAMATYLKLYILAETPLWVLVMFLILPFSYASMKGVAVIGRLAVAVMPFIIATITFFFLMGLKDMEIANIMPIGADSSFFEINLGAMIVAGRFSEIIVLVAVSFRLPKKESINGTYFKGWMLYGSVMLVMVMSVLLLMGSGFSKLLNNPFLSYARQVGGKDILQRVQVLNIFSWFSGSVLKLTIYSFLASYFLSQTVGVEKYGQKHYVVPISIIVFLLSMIPVMKRITTLHYINSDFIFPVIVFTVTFIMPLIVVIVYLFRYKNVNKAADAIIKSKDASPESPPQ